MVEQVFTTFPAEAETLKDAINETTIKNFNESSPISFSIEQIKNSSLEQLEAQNEVMLMMAIEKIKQIEAENSRGEANKELLQAEKQQLKNEIGWSNEIIKSIGSLEEARIYINAELQETEINGRKCLVRNDIDWEQKDSMGRFNKERVDAGLSPINKEGDTIELHHIGQKHDGVLAELTPDEHRGKENYSILHDSQKEAEINRVAFNQERSDHWIERAKKGVKCA